MRLPDFLIIGAMKAGTSSLHRYLGQHPDVFTSARKELDYFTRNYERGARWYMRQFRPARVAGESSPNYLKAHMFPETAARIRKDLPDARLVCVLRNPVDRTLSNYLHNVWRGREKRRFSRAIRGRSGIVMTSRYGWQLDHYLAHFPADQLLLVTTEQLHRDPESTVARVLRFVGVDGGSVRIDTSARYNVTAVNLADAQARVPADPALLNDGNGDSDSGFRLTPQARAELAEMFRADAARLRATWPDFPGWDL